MRSAIVLVLVSGCSELGLPSPPSRPGMRVTVEPLGDLARAPSVLRLRVGGGLGSTALPDYRLFQGALSSYHLGRIRARELPSTLLERELEVVTWSEPPDVVVAPALALPSGVVSLTTPEQGLVAEVAVDATLVPWLERRWPARGERRGTGLQIFCGAGASSVAEGPVALLPSGLSAELRLGLGTQGLFADSCIRLEPEGESDAVPSLPPLLVGDVALEPVPLLAGPAPLVDVVCAEGELELGPACVGVDDDRITVSTYGGPSLWAFAEPEHVLGMVESGASFVLRGLDPGTTRLAGVAFDRAGTSFAIDTEVTTEAPHAHVVINEVLANPAGPEGTSEWLELVNDGGASVDLAGFSLSDAGGSSVLPSVTLEPGAFALVVGDGFDPEPALDVLPAAGTRLVRVPALGAGGLSNSGEPLRLRDHAGRLLSTFPSLPAKHAGISIARRTPDALDTEPASFAEHATPGASPGAPNTLVDP